MGEERENNKQNFDKRPKKRGDQSSYVVIGAIIGFAIGLLLDYPAWGMLIGVIGGKLLYGSRN